jgi:hypothetical protein
MVQLVELTNAAVVEIGTTSTTHVLHRLCRVVAGRSRREKTGGQGRATPHADCIHSHAARGAWRPRSCA